jgi:hypothetical protein
MGLRAGPGRERAVTGLAAIRACWGTSLLFAPGSLLATVGADRSRGDPRARAVTRVLGARELIQAALAARDWSRTATFGGAVVDAAHAVTMVALAVRRSAYRRPAAASATVSAGFAVAGICAGRRVGGREVPRGAGDARCR